MTAQDEQNTEFFMPCGDDVVALLSQPALTDAFIRGLLRERGVFPSQSERSQLIEHFVLSYLSPGEYDAIMEKLSTKEESFKLRTVTYTLAIEEMPLSALIPKPNSLILKDVAKDPNGNYLIEGAPSFVKMPNGEFVMDFSVRRQNAGRSWIKSQERFPGKFVVSHSPDKKRLVFKAYHSSSETKSVTLDLKRWLRKDFKDRKFIKQDSEKAIEFGDFDNEQRMKFFMRFAQNFPSEEFDFEKVTDFDFRVDDQMVPSEERRISWMKGTVSRSSLKGKALHDLFILREKETWSFIKLWYIELRFKISTADLDGSFSLFLEFDGYGHSNSPKSKFQFSLGPISSRKNRDSTDKIKRKIQERLNNYVQAFAEEVLTKA